VSTENVEAPARAAAARALRRRRAAAATPPAGAANPPAGLAAQLLALGSTLPAVVAAAWVLVALPLLVVHEYRPLPATVLGLGVGVVLGRPAARAARAAAVRLGSVPWWSVAGVAIIVVAFGALAYSHSATDVLVRRDPGSYAMSGWWIAKHGTLDMPSDASAFAGTSNISLVSQGFYLQGSHTIPQFMTGAPALMAVAGWIGGLGGVFRANAFLGMFALLAFAGLVARLVGARWAPLGVLALALVQPELVTMRATYSEPSAQLVLIGGLALLLDAVAADRLGLRRNRTALVVAGLVLGLVSVVRIDAVADLFGLVPYLGWLAFRRRPAWRPIAVGLVLGLGAGVFDGAFLTLPYVRHVGSDAVLGAGLDLAAVPITAATVLIAWAARRERVWLRRWHAEVVLLGFLALAALAFAVAPVHGIIREGLVGGLVALGVYGYVVLLLMFGLRRGGGRPWSPRWPIVSAALVGLVGLFFWLRPHLMTMRSSPFSGGAGYTAQVQAILGMPVDPTRSYYEQALRWMSWYVGWSTLALTLCGAMWLAYRMTAGRSRAWLPVFAAGFCATCLVLARPSITPDHPWADRRYVPIAYPTVILFAVAAAAVGVRLVRSRLRTRAALQAGVTGALALAACAALVVPAYAGSRAVIDMQTEVGEVALVHDICAQLRPHDVVVTIGNRAPGEFPGTLRIMCGAKVALMPTPDIAALATLQQHVAARGGRVMILAEDSDEEGLPAPAVAWPLLPMRLTSTEVAHTLVTRPGLPWQLPFTVWFAPLGALPPSAADG
jgi:hypothetical protein